MRVDWNVAIAMNDGLVLRADVFRPSGEGRCPVILSYGPYAKGLAFQDGYPSAWQRMVAGHPDLARGRKLNVEISKAYRPYHSHDEKQSLKKDAAVQLDVELWPTSIVVPQGHRLALTVRGRDYEWQKSTGARLSNFRNELRGCGPFLHDDPKDRPASLFAGRTTLHFMPENPSYLLLPVIPKP